MKEQNSTSSMGYSESLVHSLQSMANRLRKNSLLATTEAGSGHPSTCFSCADLIASLFFHVLRFDVDNPDDPLNDRFILSKGHGAPILWATWAEAGAFPAEKLRTLRRIDSDLEGHPTPRNPWVDVATGSLGQGLSIGVGMAMASKLDRLDNRIFVMLGDGELAEGSVWEATGLASYYRLDNLIAIVDVNGLGQSQATMLGHDLETYRKRFDAFGWHTEVVDGHNIEDILDALKKVTENLNGPAAVIARTLKGKGVSFLENRDGWHGKPISPGKDLERALRELGEDLELKQPLSVTPVAQHSKAWIKSRDSGHPLPKPSPPEYSLGQPIATRQAYGTALKKLGAVDPSVVALDSDTKNSTYSQEFLSHYPDRFFECFIAEQNMIGAAVGLSALGKIPFASSFACFLTRAYDHIRMAAISCANLKVCGSHAGISIGEDGPSQMGLEDLAMMRTIPESKVFYPCDAVSTERLVALAAQIPGIVYIRTSRPKTPVLYSNDESFQIGGSKLLRSSSKDHATLVTAGVTVHEALQAYDQLCDEGILVRVIDLYCVKPVDAKTLRKSVRETKVLLTIEDHYPEGGLGEAVLETIASENFKYKKLAVNDLPRSGKAAQLMDHYGISARNIVEAVKALLSTEGGEIE